ncbi:cobaltochelatase subunit CobN [Pseudahrensia aquimaris]|uniref:Cobaltochelatase subunit CobN n=1 Tax=Pseudahrensia aquimaris TaxID=744461 RepID=A0ABW3FJM0_9HYPH
MHLLLAQKGSLVDDSEAVDLGQTPGEVVFLSAADTELACLAAARPNGMELRLANMMSLSHPLSVDTWCEKTVCGSKLVVARVLGGESYFAYGLEKLQETCLNAGVTFIALPGDDKPDASLDRFNSVADEHRLALWGYLVQGGAENAGHFLAYCRGLIDGDVSHVLSAQPLLKAGLWWPEVATPSMDDLLRAWREGAPVVAITFYRALLQGGNTQPVAALVEALAARGVNALPVFVSSLKDDVSQATVRALFDDAQPSVVINLTGFAVSSPDGNRVPTVLEEGGAVVLQAVLAGGAREAWEASDQGLSSRDLAMNVALPEVDGRVLARAIAFKNADDFDEAVQANIVRHAAMEDRVAFVADLAANWVRLRTAKPAERNVAIVLANYPNRDGRLGNGVGLDTPAGTMNVLRAMAGEGYRVADIPVDGDALIEHLQAGPTNAASDGRVIREVISASRYKELFEQLPKEIQDEVTSRWGGVENDPFYLPDRDALALSLARFGGVMVGIQPARGYNIDPTETYHSPDLVPPHGYFAFYFFLREEFGAHAIVHMGKHGNMEWLPGKALSLSRACYPEAVFGPLPHVYPFIVNDPGEGTQAKRRASAVIIDHLTPPLTRAETYGPLKELEALVDEYYEASGVDPRRLAYLKKQIVDLMRDTGLQQDAGIADSDDEGAALEKLDAYLCELKEMQIRDGLHIFGEAPQGRLLTDLTVALARVPRGQGEGADASLQRALAADLGLDGFDPLDCDMGKAWEGARPEALASVDDGLWRSNGDTVERLELLATALVSGELACNAPWERTQTVLEGIEGRIKPAVTLSGEKEISGLLTALDGRFVEPGSSGAPTRGRLDVLPTGRNFFSVDSRAVPTPAAWYLGQKSAELLIKRHRQDHGAWPTSFGLSAWGTSNMRTGGDDIAQAMALIGVKPVWDHGSRRVTGYEVITPAQLGRPRVDVTLRISGFFRDAFPAQIELFDKAVRAVAALDEDAKQNPIAARVAKERAELIGQGVAEAEADLRAGFRIFGSKPGAYGAGLQALIDEKGWNETADLARAYLAWGSYAYGAKAAGAADEERFVTRLSTLEAVVHNQDNREHDLLDSDDYYQFEGGMTAAVEHVQGAKPAVYHNDHSRPERPVIRTLEEEIGRVVRGRVVNPKWIAGVMRHGYKGAFEMAATVDYMFAFSATTGAVRDHHFDAVYQAFLVDDEVREFLADKNPHALKEMADRLLEAQDRGLWTARSNSAKFDLEQLAGRESA